MSAGATHRACGAAGGRGLSDSFCRREHCRGGRTAYSDRALSRPPPGSGCRGRVSREYAPRRTLRQEQRGAIGVPHIHMGLSSTRTYGVFFVQVDRTSPASAKALEHCFTVGAWPATYSLLKRSLGLLSDDVQAVQRPAERKSLPGARTLGDGYHPRLARSSPTKRISGLPTPRGGRRAAPRPLSLVVLDRTGSHGLGSAMVGLRPLASGSAPEVGGAGGLAGQSSMPPGATLRVFLGAHLGASSWREASGSKPQHPST